MNEKPTASGRPHALRLDDRSSLYLTGVVDVCGFDETSILIRLDGYLLSVDGEELRILGLNVEGGEMTVTGTINGLNYVRDGKGTKNGEKKSLLSGLFR
ncbi:MAG: sporulation protein YabP [Lachnospiraceae bacterium]|nr:sporulation protein YabP [Lachnospiraceae bacterium]